MKRQGCTVDLGLCTYCDAVHFVCPQCKSKHNRGYVDGVDTFRCLRCGYAGHGFHTDAETDRLVGVEIRQNQAANVSLGLPPGPFHP